MGWVWYLRARILQVGPTGAGIHQLCSPGARHTGGAANSLRSCFNFGSQATAALGTFVPFTERSPVLMIRCWSQLEGLWEMVCCA